jgi:uncharacterized protein (DUF58 family)
MDKLGRHDFAGMLSLGVAAAVLLAGWIANSAQIAARHERQLAREAVTVTADGRMKVTVTANAREGAPSRQVNAAASGSSATTSAISTLAPLLLRP